MKNFGGLITDTLPINLPPGNWLKARNIIKNKKLDAVSNEYAHTLFTNQSAIYLGEVSTAKDIVFFGVSSTGNSLIYRQRLGDDVNPIEKVFDSAYLGFNKSRPIEGIAVYNYLDELIIAFCDGIFEDSNSPKVINIDNPPVELDANKELVTPANVNRLEMFPDVQEANINLSYLESGDIDGLFAYVTYCYVFKDGSTTAYFPVSNVAYLGEGVDPVNRRGMRLGFSGLDSSFSKLRIGLVVVNDSNLVGYESYDISYTGTAKTIDVSTLSNFESTAAENIVLNKIVFDKFETITKQNNRVVVGKYTIKPRVPLQKYFCNLTLSPYLYLGDRSTPGLMPDEVYSFYGQVQWKDGSYSEAFHIPNRVAQVGTDAPDAAFISEWGLDWLDQYPSVDWREFHFYNRGRVSSNNTGTRYFGVWQNTSEYYPNDEEYDGSEDYNGSNIPGGTDLRNQPIRYHRVPALNEIARNSGYVPNTFYTDPKQFWKVGVSVMNFADAFPSEIRDQIQGYRICFVKRDIGNSLVSGNWFATRRGDLEWSQGATDITYEYYNFNYNESTYDTRVSQPDIRFDNLRLISPELFKTRPNLDLTFIKTNYLFSAQTQSPQLLFADNNELHAPTYEGLTYRPGNNLAASTQYLEEGVNLDTGKTDYLKSLFTNTPTNAINFERFYMANVSGISFKNNVYPGFKSADLVVLGRTSTLNSVVDFKGGDVFNDNQADMHIHYASFEAIGNDARIIVARYYQYLTLHGLYSPINGSLIENDEPTRKDEDFTIGDNEEPDRINEEYYFTNDYDFDVKNEDDLSKLNDINTILTFEPDSQFIDTFLYRFHRGISIGKETLNTSGLRTFLSDEYYEVANDRGDLVALRGSDRVLYIQYENSLYVAVLKDILRANNVDAYLGEPDILERTPQEVLPDSKGTISSVSKMSCKVIKGMYIALNAIDGQIYIVSNSAKEITRLGNRNWFNKNWDIGLTYYNTHPVTGRKIRVDHPSIAGYSVGYDERFERLFVTKRYFEPTQAAYNESIYSFDGNFFSNDSGIVSVYTSGLFQNKSETLSFSLEDNLWMCWHDIEPGAYIHTPNRFLSVKTDPGQPLFYVFQHNDQDNVGVYHGIRHESYVDLVFNGDNSFTKVYQAVRVISNAIKDNVNYKDVTIDKMVIYNDNQCSGEIDLSDLTRNANNEFNFNEFRDLVIDAQQPIINEDGSINESNINYDKLWFERSYFMSKFIVVRLIMSNTDATNIYLTEVNVKSVVSKR